MIDDQAKETVPIYAKAQTGFPQKSSSFKLKEYQWLERYPPSSTPIMPNTIQDHYHHQIQISDAAWTRLRSDFDEGEWEFNFQSFQM